MRGFALALLLLATLAAAAEQRFSKTVIDTNVLAVGEVSHIQLSGALQPLTIALRPQGSRVELHTGTGSGPLPIQTNTSLADSGILRIEVKALKPFRGNLVIRDAEGRTADFNFYIGDEKLLRDMRGLAGAKTK
jgi:hypothetical protein